MLLPELLSKKTQSAEDSIITLSLRIPSELEFFIGHFPDFPILPGVVQIHWATHFAREQWSVLGQFSRLESIKFHSVILPNTALDLNLQWRAEKSWLDFTYASTQKKYANGRIVFNSELANNDAV